MKLTRRDLLKTGAGAALGSTLLAQPNHAAAPSTQRIRFGVSTYSYWHFAPQNIRLKR